jgi:hypothetical protein
MLKRCGDQYQRGVLFFNVRCTFVDLVLGLFGKHLYARAINSLL